MVENVSWEQLNKKGNALLSPSYKSNGHVFTSGCLGTNTSGELPDDLKLQTEYSIKNLEEVLKASGSSLDRVLKVLLFIADKSYVKEVNEVYGMYFTSRPGRSCVVVGFPNPKVKVEIECVAEYDNLNSKL